MTSPSPLIALAAGGTGGHMFPAEALARTLLNRNCRVALVTDHRGKAFGADLADVALHRVDAASPGAGLTNKVRAVAALTRGWFQARRLLKSLSPAVVVGFGGYPSIPTVFAASGRRIPVVLHEPNAVLGRANRVLAGRSVRIATAFDAIAKLSSGHAQMLVRVGTPVRPAFLSKDIRPYESPGDDGPIRLLVLGGSQGARILSQVVPDALIALPEALRTRLAITQQCRPEDLSNVESTYTAAGVTATLAPFFSDVPDLMAASHLVIGRAGASTIAELSVMGRPAILIPYRYAMDDHQRANAQALADIGAAWVMPESELTISSLMRRVSELLQNPRILPDAAQASRGFGRPDAADLLADVVMEVAGVAPNQATGETAQ